MVISCAQQDFPERGRDSPETVSVRPELVALCAKHIERERITTFEGWFKETLPRLAGGTKLAMAHLDCDLYSSTFGVLDHLLAQEHLADGALLFFDDGNRDRASPRFRQRTLNLDRRPKGLAGRQPGVGLNGSNFR